MVHLTPSQKRHHRSYLSPFPSKKPNIRPLPSIPESPSPTPLRCFASPSSLPRRHHAPRRLLKPTGLSLRLSNSFPRSPYCRCRRRSPATKMGNLVSRVLCGKKPGSDSDDGLRLEEGRYFPPPSDLRAFSRDGLAGSSYVVNRKVGDARSVVLESVPRYKVLSQKRKAKEDLLELFSPLSDREEKCVSDALKGRSSYEVLVIHEASNIEITGEILRCLNNGGWLNDEVINLYLELLKEREKREPEKFLKCHFFNTFFYKKLTGGGNGYDFKSVRRWTTQKKLGYGLIECDKIFVPIHKDTHWCLGVINVNEGSFQYLDSLGAVDRTVSKVLARYFMDEMMDKSDKQISNMSWKQVEPEEYLPLQKNGYDCGMFMLKYIDFYSRGLPICFSQEHMPYFRKRTAMEILNLRAD